MSATTSYQIYPISDQAVTLDFGGPISLETNDRVYILMDALIKNKLEGVTDVIPAYNSVTVVYDYMTVYQRQLKNENVIPVYTFIKDWIENNVNQDVNAIALSKNEIIIPVCYDKSVAPDIESVADQHQMSTQKVIELHTAKTYRVFMNGFLPGFAYMGYCRPSYSNTKTPKPKTACTGWKRWYCWRSNGYLPLQLARWMANYW